MCMHELGAKAAIIHRGRQAGKDTARTVCILLLLHSRLIYAISSITGFDKQSSLIMMHRRIVNMFVNALRNRRNNYLICDIRSAKAYDLEHITKPPKTCVSVPWEDGADFAGRAEAKLGRSKTRGVLVMSVDGAPEAQQAQRALTELGYTSVMVIEGGYGAPRSGHNKPWHALLIRNCPTFAVGWRKLYTSTGRDTPPPGRCAHACQNPELCESTRPPAASDEQPSLCLCGLRFLLATAAGCRPARRR